MWRRGRAILTWRIRSARSLKALNAGLAVDLFTDQAVEPGLFDRVRPIPEGPTPKLAALPETRFDRTLYLDCDTLALAPLGDLFDILNRFELAVAHDVRRTSSLIREGAQEAPPYAFPQMNAGVMLYRRSAAMLAFLRDWQAALCRGGQAARPADAARSAVGERSALLRAAAGVQPAPGDGAGCVGAAGCAPDDPAFAPAVAASARGGCAAGQPGGDPAGRAAARAEEWRAAGLPDPAAGGDAVLAYLLAEAQEMAQAAAAE